MEVWINQHEKYSGPFRIVALDSKKAELAWEDSGQNVGWHSRDRLKLLRRNDHWVDEYGKIWMAPIGWEELRASYTQSILAARTITRALCLFRDSPKPVCLQTRYDLRSHPHLEIRHRQVINSFTSKSASLICRDSKTYSPQFTNLKQVFNKDRLKNTEVSVPTTQ